jgi:hypothetical protein
VRDVTVATVGRADAVAGKDDWDAAREVELVVEREVELDAAREVELVVDRDVAAVDGVDGAIFSGATSTKANSARAASHHAPSTWIFLQVKSVSNRKTRRLFSPDS